MGPPCGHEEAFQTFRISSKWDPFPTEEPVSHVVRTSAGFWGLVGKGLHMLFALSPSAWPEATERGSSRMHSSQCVKVVSPQECGGGHFTPESAP